MSSIEVMVQKVYKSPTKGRRYLSARAAANAEARALMDRKYPREEAEYENGMMIFSGWHWSSDERNVRACARLGRLILKQFRAAEIGRAMP